ncbi:MAG: DUF4982 domain-containing protein [Roseburia sp.]|nr:DUF4982 domain-containing protein [Roseburia sp.]
MKQLFNDNWSFCKFPLDTPMEQIMNADGFTPVDLPHDWMIYDAENLYEQAVSCYKKTFDKNELLSDAPAAKIWLVFEGVYMDTTVYLNGTHIFTWKNGYSEFMIDLTELLDDGENELLVRNEYHLPNSRWYPGSGIYRDVWLITSDVEHFVHNGTYLSTRRLGKTWEVFMDAEYICEHASDAKEGTIRHIITDADGKEIQTHEHTISLSAEIQTDKQVMTVIDPILWDTEAPYLYQITSELFVGSEKKDSLTQNLGFRHIEFDADKGFFLNDRHMKINGTGEHHVLGALGAAMNQAALRRQLLILKEMGVNSVRNAHNMPCEHMLNLCDELGLLLYTESFDMWERTKTDFDYGNDFSEWWKKDLTSWVRQNRNHPCVFIWGIGNEIYDTHFDRGLEITKELHEAVRELDYRKNAYTALASNYIEWEAAQRTGEIIDLVGYNYLDKCYDEHHKKYPDWKIFGSESSATLQSRGVYHFPLSNRLLTTDDLQCSSLGNCTTNWGAKNSEFAIITHRDREFCFGQYVWSGFDYIGEPTPYFTKNSYFGQIDTAGFKKDSFYMYQSAWTDYKKNPVVHLLPYWDFNEGQLIDVRIFSNAPKVELLYQGQSQGIVEIDHEHGQVLSGDWQIPYAEGTITALAYDENDTVIAKDEQRSFGDPAVIRLTPDKTSLHADGEDLIFLTIDTLDKNQVPVANGRSRMHVSVTGAGRLIGLDNGDSSDYDQYKGTSRKLFSGKLLAIIAAKTEPGEIYVSVTSPSLPDASLTLKALPAQKRRGVSCQMENEKSLLTERTNEDGFVIPDRTNEIPVRKIALTNHGTNHLDAEHTSAAITAKLYPENTTYKDICFKAVTLNGVDSNAVKIETDPETNTATLHAAGDGEFRLLCTCNNGLDHVEVMSELEFEVTGLGEATHDAYEIVSGINYSSSSDDGLILSFQGGVYITGNERTTVTFENVDFGDYGADEIHLPIFSFSDDLPLEVWQGIPDTPEDSHTPAKLGDSSPDGECLLSDTYHAKSWYNHYQENVFKLSKRLKGIQTITIVVYPEIKMSLQGFYFTKIEKAYAKLNASDCANVTGDMFTRDGDAIREIGNNVTVEYDNMHFDEDGFRGITIHGRSHIEMNTIHVRFIPADGNGDTINQIIDFPYSDEAQTLTFDLEPVYGDYNLNLIFLPGCKFDLEWLQIEK